MTFFDNQTEAAKQQRIAFENARFMFVANGGFIRPFTPVRTLPPGIFWERTGGKTWRVVIRREPEVVVDRGEVA